jgi:predicted dienelactone hydrolase
VRALAVVICLLGLAACSSGTDASNLAAQRSSTTEPPSTEPSTGPSTERSTTTTAPRGPFEVTSTDRTLTGATPQLFVRIWSPEDAGRGTRKLIVLAHGLNGEPDKFDDLSSSWARAGYVVAAPRFPGSSATGGGQVAGFDEQPAEVSSVIDQLTADATLRLDPDHVAVAGLSLGGSTIYALTTDPCCIDPRIDAAAIFDGLRPGPFGKAALVPNEVPVLIIHCDHDPVLQYEAHAVGGFDRMVDPAWLVTLPCVEHPQPYEDEPSPFDPLVERVTLDLWDAALRGGPEAGPAITADVEADDHGATLRAKGEAGA